MDLEEEEFKSKAKNEQAMETDKNIPNLGKEMRCKHYI